MAISPDKVRFGGDWRHRAEYQVEVESLTQMKSRVLDSMQDLVRNGVLIVSDFTQFTPASVRKTLAKSDPEKNACAK
jgi:hypothetical protein